MFRGSGASTHHRVASANAQASHNLLTDQGERAHARLSLGSALAEHARYDRTRSTFVPRFCSAVSLPSSVTALHGITLFRSPACPTRHAQQWGSLLPLRSHTEVVPRFCSAVSSPSSVAALHGIILFRYSACPAGHTQQYTKLPKLRLRASAPAYVPFTSPMVHASRVVQQSPFPLSRLLRARGIYNVRKAPASVLRALLVHTGCAATHAQFDLRGQNSVQIRRDLNQRLAQELADGTHGAAFVNLCALDERPRADDLERMVATFPGGLDAVDWSAPAVGSGLDVDLWKAMHSRHCAKCTASTVHDDCYFKLVAHFIRTGFEPARTADFCIDQVRPSVRAYVDLWFDEREGCETAFQKWLHKADNLISSATKH